MFKSLFVSCASEIQKLVFHFSTRFWCWWCILELALLARLHLVLELDSQAKFWRQFSFDGFWAILKMAKTSGFGVHVSAQTSCGTCQSTDAASVDQQKSILLDEPRRSCCPLKSKIKTFSGQVFRTDKNERRSVHLISIPEFFRDQDVISIVVEIEES